MSDFDAFGDAPAVEEDPAAAFLAREQSDLAALEGDEFGLEQTAPAAAQADFTGDDAFGAQEPSATDGGLFDPLEGATEQEMGGPDFGEAAPSDPYGSIKTVDTQRAEPEKIRIWREGQAKMLEEKDAAEQVTMQEWRDKAAQELEDWYKLHEEQVSNNKRNNREAEEVFVEELNDTVPGHEWERICRMCDFNPKSSSRANKDTSRMRSILLHLKQTPLVR